MKASLPPLLLGFWLGVLVASWVAATVNFRTVDRVLGAGQRGELAARLAPVPGEDRRLVLRHLASEINRRLFRWWSLAQLLLGVALLALAWPGDGAARWVLGGVLLIVLAQALAVGPIVSLGRSIDFAPRPLPAELARRFGLLHAGYVLADLLKALLLVAAAFAVGRGAPRTG